MKNVVAYCRVSTKSDDQLNSLEAQKIFFEDYSKQHNLNLIKIYADEGITGTQLKKRKQFQQMMEDAKSGIFDTVLVKDVSRFARNTVDFLNSLRGLKEYKVKVEFVNLPDEITGSSEFIITIFSSLAQAESETISKRVKYGKRVNAKRGKVPNIVFGYNKIEGEIFTLEINEEEAAVVRRIFDMYVKDRYGALKIAGELNAEGLLTKRGSKWTQTAVSRILKNELYIGKVINGETFIEDFLTGKRKARKPGDDGYFVHDKPELKIIDEEIFEEAQKLLEQRNIDFNLNKKRNTNRYPFSTLIRCKHCGYSFRRMERKYKNQYVRWVCSGRNAHGVGSCSNITKIDEKEMLEGIKTQMLILLKDKPNLIKQIRKEFERIFNEKDNRKKTLEDLKEEIKEVTKRRDIEIEYYENGVITINELAKKTKPLVDRIERLEYEIELAKAELKKPDVFESRLAVLFKDIETAINTNHLTNGMLKRIFEKIVVDDSGNVEFFLYLPEGIGLSETVLLSNVCP